MFNKSIFLTTLYLGALSVDASNHKRGFEAAQKLRARDVAALTNVNNSAVSWYYTVDHGHQTFKHFSEHFEFVVSQSSIAEASLRTLAATVKKNKPKQLLTFPIANDNKSIDDQVASWRRYIVPLQKKYPDMAIGSPTVLAGTTQIEKKSLNSLDKFIDKCPECKFDFVPINYYGQSKDFKSHIEFWHKSFPAKPLWITDVNVGQSIADAHQTDPEFLKANKDIVTYLDDADYVQRYAFGYLYEARPNLSFVNKQGKLSALGRFYVAGDKA